MGRGARYGNGWVLRGASLPSLDLWEFAHPFPSQFVGEGAPVRKGWGQL